MNGLNELQQKLRISEQNLKEINNFLLQGDNPLINDLLELIDYFLTPQSTSSGSVIFYVKGSSSFPFTVSIADLVGLSPGSIAVSAKRFEARSAVIVSAVSEVITGSEVNTSTDQLTITRVYTTGEKIRFTGSDLPDHRRNPPGR